jgi:hypothetical protein
VPRASSRITETASELVGGTVAPRPGVATIRHPAKETVAVRIGVQASGHAVISETQLHTQSSTGRIRF